VVEARVSVRSYWRREGNVAKHDQKELSNGRAKGYRVPEDPGVAGIEEKWSKQAQGKKMTKVWRKRLLNDTGQRSARSKETGQGGGRRSGERVHQAEWRCKGGEQRRGGRGRD